MTIEDAKLLINLVKSETNKGYTVNPQLVLRAIEAAALVERERVLSAVRKVLETTEVNAYGVILAVELELDD